MRYQSTTLHPRTQDITGQSYGSWTVVHYAGAHKGETFWLCECVCRMRRDLARGELMKLRGLPATCRGHRKASRHTQRGLSHMPEYRIWEAMIRRCEVPTSLGYSNYGGRGIVVCAAWHDFTVFYADMGSRQGPEYSLDRYPDPNGNYEPSNCRWATRAMQNRNKRTNHFITLHGVRQCVTDWAQDTGIPVATITHRITHGWTEEETLTLPPSHGNTPLSRVGGHPILCHPERLRYAKGLCHPCYERERKHKRQDQTIEHLDDIATLGTPECA